MMAQYLGGMTCPSSKGFTFAQGHGSFPKLLADSPPTQLLSQALIEFRTEV